MIRAERSNIFLPALVALFLALALGGQAVADGLVPDTSAADTNRAVGRAASSYLAGLKTFAAAALWNRTDPLLHNYYAEVPLDDQRYMLSTIAAVQMLDPHAVQSYYIGSWILARNDRLEEGLEMAERGVRENPDAGILRVGLAQMRMLLADDLPGALEMAESVLTSDMQWTDVVEEANAYMIVGAILRAGGRDDLDAVVQDHVMWLEAEYPDELHADDHDHDGDGVQDH